MNRATELETMIHSNGGKVYLWQILERHDGLACKHTQACSELRSRLKQRGFTVLCHKNFKVPSDTYYTIEPLQVSGQGELFREAV